MANDKMDDSGLRYRIKSGGSPYSTANTPGKTMSCFRCGLHKPRQEGSMVQIVGSRQFVCGDCRPQSAAQKKT